MHTGVQHQAGFSPVSRHGFSVLIELTLGYLCCRLTDVPPQPNSQPDNVFRTDLSDARARGGEREEREEEKKREETGKRAKGETDGTTTGSQTRSKQTEQRQDRQTDERTGGRPDTQTNRQTDRQAHRPRDRQTDRQAGGPTGTGRPTDRQTDRERKEKGERKREKQRERERDRKTAWGGGREKGKKREERKGGRADPGGGGGGKRALGAQQRGAILGRRRRRRLSGYTQRSPTQPPPPPNLGRPQKGKGRAGRGRQSRHCTGKEYWQVKSADTVLASDCTSEKKKANKIPKFAPENFPEVRSRKFSRRNFEKTRVRQTELPKKFSGSENYGNSHKKPGRIEAVNHPKAKKKFTRNYPDKTQAKKSRTLKKGAKNEKRAKQKKRTAFAPCIRQKRAAFPPCGRKMRPHTNTTSRQCTGKQLSQSHSTQGGTQGHDHKHQHHYHPRRRHVLQRKPELKPRARGQTDGRTDRQQTRTKPEPDRPTRPTPKPPTNAPTLYWQACAWRQNPQKPYLPEQGWQTKKCVWPVLVWWIKELHRPLPPGATQKRAPGVLVLRTLGGQKALEPRRAQKGAGRYVQKV